MCALALCVAVVGAVFAERSHEQLRDALQEWTSDHYPKDDWPWLKSVFDGSFVYSRDGKLWKRTYEFSDTGSLSVGEAEEVTESYDPVGMAVFALGEAVFSGDMVKRTGKLFQAGDYPDKNFSITAEEMATAATAFRPVDNDLEHRSTILDRKIGQLESVQARGAELFGTVVIPKWLNDTLGAEPLKVSLAWDRPTKRIIGNGLVLNPRVSDAQVCAAFARSTGQRRSNTMNWKQRWDAFWSGLNSSEQAEFNANPPVQPVTQTQVQTRSADPEVAQLRAQLRQRDTARLTDSGARFADDQEKAKKALPGEKKAITALFAVCAQHDARSRSTDGNDVAVFSDAGEVIDGDALKSLRELFNNRLEMDVTAEVLKNAGRVVVLAADDVKPAIDGAGIYAKREAASTGAKS